MRKFKIFILFSIFVSCYSINAQNYSQISGDAAGNIPTVMKAFDNGLYIASKNVSSSGITTAIFSKYNITTGSLIWAKKLDFEAEILDFEFVDPTIILNATKSFILVGRTLPLSSTTTPIDNKSFVIRMDDLGGIIFSKIYNQNGREEFSKIKFHPFPYPQGSTPVNLNNAFYISGLRNPISGQINDNFTTTLYNFSISGTGSIIWSNEYNFNNNTLFSQLLNRGLVSLSNGMLLLLGQNSNSGSGSQLYVNPNNGNKIYNNESDASQIDYSINDAIEIQNNLLVAVGHTVNPILGRNPGFVSIINTNTFFRTFFVFDNLESIKNVYMDKDSNYYVTALTVPGTRGNPNPIRFNNVCKFRINWATNPISFQIIWEKSINDSESEYTQAYLYTNTKLSNLFYCDGRINNTGYGLLDVYYGSFDMNLSSRCSVNLTDNLTYRAFFQDFSSVRQLQLTVPLPITGTWSNITYLSKDICSPCNLSINLSNSPLQCFSGVISSTITGGTGPYSYSWDLDCDGIGIINNSNPNFNYNNITAGQHCLKITVVDLSNGCSIEKSITFVVTNTSSLTVNCMSTILTTLPGKCYNEYQGINSIVNPCNLPLSNIYSSLSGATTGIFLGTGLIQFNKGITTVIVGEIGDPPRIICSYTVTVNDEENPTIICPSNKTVIGLICDTGSIVTFQNPIVTDNCPMVNYTCSKLSESKFACGNTIVTCTATDMAGNTNSCNFNVDVICKCIEIDSSNISCSELHGEYYFSVIIKNYTGSILPCTNVIISSVNATIHSGYTTTLIGLNDLLVMGVLTPNSSTLTSVNLIATMDCSCGYNLNSFACSDNITMVVPCCKVAILDPNKICKDDASYLVNLNFSEPVYNISSVEWYFKCGDCLASTPYIHYATTFDPSVDIYPNSIDCPENKICIYAIVHLLDGNCTSLISNPVTIVFCKPKCTIDTFQACYSGNQILGGQLHLKPFDTCCIKEINWYDPEGNPLPLLYNQWSINLPPLSFTGLPTDCKEIKKFKAIINTVCGVDSCYGTVILYNGLIANGSLSMDPLEFPGPPYCPGDFTLKYTPTCPDQSEHPTWSWYSGFPLGSVVALGPLIGNMNGSLNTNFINNDTYYQVRSTNGICPEQKIDYFLDMRQVLKSLSFSALSNSCNDGPVTLTETFGVVTCPVIIDWYRNGILIHTSTYTSSPATYFYIISPAIDYSGNYYCIIKSTCCDVVSKSNISTINHPMVVGVQAPCYTCSALESIKYTAVVENPLSGSCTYAWQKQVGSFWVPNFPLPTTNNMFTTNSRKVRVKVSCGPCMKIVEKSVSTCKTKPIIIDIPDITISLPSTGSGGNNFRQVYTCGSIPQVEFRIDSRDTFPEPGTMTFSGNLNISDEGISDIIWQLEDEKKNIIKEGYLEIPEKDDSFTIKDIVAKELSLDQLYRLRITGYYDEDSVTCIVPFILKSVQICCKSDTAFENIVESAISLTFDDQICKAKININGLPEFCTIKVVNVKWGDGAVTTGSFGNGDLIMHTYAPTNVSYIVRIDVLEYDFIHANGTICNSYQVRRIVSPSCIGCCKDYKKFKALIAQGFQKDVSDCKVTVTTPQFSDCHYLDFSPDFGDGSPIQSGPFTTDQEWMHQYNQSGTYNICATAYEYKNGDRNDICWYKKFCTKVTINCPDTCVCEGFNNLVFRYDKTNEVKAKCNDSLTLQCPPNECVWNFSGELKCIGSCSRSQVEWQLTGPLGIVLANGLTNTYPSFGIYIPPSIVSSGGHYTLILKGHCGNSTCTCLIKLFFPGCNSVCPCDPDDLEADVNSGVQIISESTSCLACFQPVALTQCDEVKWYLLSNPNQAFASSIGNQIICYKFPNPGNYKIKMSVTRLNDDGSICSDYERVFTLPITCQQTFSNISCDNIRNFVQIPYSWNYNSLEISSNSIEDRTTAKLDFHEISGNLMHGTLLATGKEICFDEGDYYMSLNIRSSANLPILFGTTLKIYLVEYEFLNSPNGIKDWKLIGKVDEFQLGNDWRTFRFVFDPIKNISDECNQTHEKRFKLVMMVENQLDGLVEWNNSKLEVSNVCLSFKVNEGNLLPEALIVPNPSASDFSLTLLNDDAQQIVITCFNSTGESIFIKNTSEQFVNFKFGSEWSSGIYFVKIQNNLNHQLFKIVKLN